jgi:hypothetical protein
MRQHGFRWLLAGCLALAVLGCRPDPKPDSVLPEQTEWVARPDGFQERYALQQMVVLSRHNIRSPMVGKGSVLTRLTNASYSWFPWEGAPSTLTLKGERLETQMGGFFREWGPFVAGIMGLSAFSSLICLFGLFSPTGDVNVTFGWAILVFFLIMHFKFRGGLWNYFKGLFSPIPVFAPMNLIGEFATPVSMAFRHYGNILSGAVISALIGSALTGLSKSLLGWLPSVLGDMPLLRVGLPAVLSMYFDIFSGVMQAFIFAMLTMLNVSGAVPWEDWNARRKKRNKPEIQNTAA